MRVIDIAGWSFVVGPLALFVAGIILRALQHERDVSFLGNELALSNMASATSGLFLVNRPDAVPVLTAVLVVSAMWAGVVCVLHQRMHTSTRTTLRFFWLGFVCNVGGLGLMALTYYAAKHL